MSGTIVWLFLVGSTFRLLRSIVPQGKTPILAPFFTLLPLVPQSTPDLK